MLSIVLTIGSAVQHLLDFSLSEQSEPVDKLSRHIEGKLNLTFSDGLWQVLDLCWQGECFP